MVATQKCDLQGEDYLSFFPLSAPVWIVGSTVVRLIDCLGGQPASHWPNNLLYGDILKGRPSFSAARSGLL